MASSHYDDDVSGTEERICGIDFNRYEEVETQSDGFSGDGYHRVDGFDCRDAFSIPLLLYMKGHPIKLTGDVAEVMIRYGFEPLIPFLVEPSIFINQTMTVLAISILASLYPLWSTEKIKVSDVLRA